MANNTSTFLIFKGKDLPALAMELAALCLEQFLKLAPRARFELATNRLTVDRSTTELPRNVAFTVSDDTLLLGSGASFSFV